MGIEGRYRAYDGAGRFLIPQAGIGLGVGVTGGIHHQAEAGLITFPMEVGFGIGRVTSVMLAIRERPMLVVGGSISLANRIGPALMIRF